MNNNESTVFGAAQEQPKNETEQKTVGNSSWKQVSIGGVTGILMGAAGMYAANAFAGEQPEETDEQQANAATEPQSSAEASGLRVAEVDQNLSFGEAFAAARNEVGPGGVFRWHGGLYNTYTAQEWNSMSDGEHQQFAQQVQPEIRPGEERTGHQEAQHDTAHNNNDRRKVDDDSTHDDDSRKHDDDDTHVVRHDEPEVHFLGVDQVQTESGQTWNVGHMVVGSQEVALVDVDDNMVFDVAVTDRNDNGKIEEDEVVDISDRQLSVTDFALASSLQESGNGDTPHPETASNSPQDQIAEDMPDYMNDADVQTV